MSTPERPDRGDAPRERRVKKPVCNCQKTKNPFAFCPVHDMEDRRRPPEDVRGADVGEARASLAAELEGVRDAMMVVEDWEPSYTADVMTRAAAALRSPEPAAEPVAWMVHAPNTDFLFVTAEYDLVRPYVEPPGHHYIVPLYAHPPSAEPEERPTPEPVAAPRNHHGSMQLGGKSADTVSVLVTEALDEIVDELSDYSKTLTTCGRIRVHLHRFAERLLAEPSAEPATGRDQKMGVTEQEVPSAGGEPRYTLAEVADMLEANVPLAMLGTTGPGAYYHRLGWMGAARWLRSGGATTETGERP